MLLLYPAGGAGYVGSIPWFLLGSGLRQIQINNFLERF
jgi:hypothetical protein